MKLPTFAPIYVSFFPMLAEIAQGHGYALTVHGSLMVDLDLVAVPWTEKADSAEVLVEAMRKYATWFMSGSFGKAASISGPELKPHGRCSWSLIVGNGAVIDVSVLPRLGDVCATEKLESMRQRKDGAYEERNRVVSALARCFPSGLARTNIEGWDPEWHGCVYIDLPTGQASWHFHDSQAYLFEGLPAYTKPWDGHTTEEKYIRLNEFCKKRAWLSSAE